MTIKTVTVIRAFGARASLLVLGFALALTPACKNKNKGTDTPEGGGGEVAAGPGETGPKPPSLPDAAPPDPSKAPLVSGNAGDPLPDHNDRDPEEEKKKMSLSRDRSKKAVEHLEAGRLDQAIDEARQALRIHEQNAEAMLVIAEAFYKQGKHEIVQSVTSSILNIDPARLSALEEAKARNLKGFAYLQQGKRPSAMKEFRLAADKDPKNASAWNNLGVMYMWQGDLATAESCFSYVIELDGRFVGAHLNHGASLRGLGRLEDAKKAFERVLELDPKNAMASFNLGVLYLDGEKMAGMDIKARYNEAIAHFNRYKQNAPSGGGKSVDAKLNTGLGQNPLGNELVSVEQADLYIDAANKGIEREVRREERDQKRKEKEARDAAKKAEAEKKPAEGETKPAEGGKTEGDKAAPAPLEPQKPPNPPKPQKPGGA